MDKQVGDMANKPKAGILRLDINKSHNRRTSGGSSVEFRSSPEVLGDVSIEIMFEIFYKVFIDNLNLI